MESDQIIEFDIKWVKERIKLPMTKWAEQLAREVTRLGRDNLTVTQLRRFFGQVKKIQTRGLDNSVDELYMLLPELTYAVAKAKNKEGIVIFKKAIEPALKEVLKQLDENTLKEVATPFNNFVKILEALVAYHKVYDEANKKKNND